MRRAEQVEHNRGIVLEAARTVFLERGYGGATLGAIADEAGFSRGVVYSQFGSKADMFFALLDRRIEQRAEQNGLITKEFQGSAGLRRLIMAGEDDAAAQPGWAHLLVEFRVLAMRDPELKRRYAEAHSRTVDGIATVVERLYEPDGEPPVPSRVIAEYLQAGAAGVALERAANPDALPVDDVLILLSGALRL